MQDDRNVVTRGCILRVVDSTSSQVKAENKRRKRKVPEATEATVGDTPEVTAEKTPLDHAAQEGHGTGVPRS